MSTDPDEDFVSFVRRQRERSRGLDTRDDIDEDDDIEKDDVDEDVALVEGDDVALRAQARELVMTSGRVVKPVAVRHRLAQVREKPPEKHVAPLRGDRAWLASPRITRTENGLRLALHLLQQLIPRSDVAFALTGSEMSGRAKRPLFPVDGFLAEHGCTRGLAGATDDPEATYYMVEGAEYRIALSTKVTEAPLWCALAGRARLLVDVMGGSMSPTRSSAEHTLLRTALGRLITLPDVRKGDVLAVAMPRSARFRQLVSLWRLAPKVAEARIRLLLVDRAGLVDGLKGLSRRLD